MGENGDPQDSQVIIHAAASNITSDKGAVPGGSRVEPRAPVRCWKGRGRRALIGWAIRQVIPRPMVSTPSRTGKPCGKFIKENLRAYRLGIFVLICPSISRCRWYCSRGSISSSLGFRYCTENAEEWPFRLSRLLSNECVDSRATPRMGMMIAFPPPKTCFESPHLDAAPDHQHPHQCRAGPSTHLHTRPPPPSPHPFSLLRANQLPYCRRKRPSSYLRALAFFFQTDLGPRSARGLGPSVRMTAPSLRPAEHPHTHQHHTPSRVRAQSCLDMNQQQNRHPSCGRGLTRLAQRGMTVSRLMVMVRAVMRRGRDRVRRG